MRGFFIQNKKHLQFLIFHEIVLFTSYFEKVIKSLLLWCYAKTTHIIVCCPDGRFLPILNELDEYEKEERRGNE